MQIIYIYLVPIVYSDLCFSKLCLVIMQIPQCWELFQNLAYAAISDVHTVFFSKRQKNSSLCAHHTAPWFCFKESPFLTLTTYFHMQTGRYGIDMQEHRHTWHTTIPNPFCFSTKGL